MSKWFSITHLDLEGKLSIECPPIPCCKLYLNTVPYIEVASKAKWYHFAIFPPWANAPKLEI